MTDYSELAETLSAISRNVNCEISILANASALLYDALDNLNWCGFYLMQNGRLVLGPFQGKIACTEIDMGKGVCGTAAAKNTTVLVENVHTFDGHIACDSASNSEVVVPIHKNGALYGVLDIDSPVLSRFSAEDAAGLELVVKSLEAELERLE